MPDLVRTFRFNVTLRQSAAAVLGSGPRSVPTTADSGDSLGDGGFQECSGLDIEMDVQAINEGGRNDGVIQRAGRAKYSPLVLKRGMFYGGQDGLNKLLKENYNKVIRSFGNGFRMPSRAFSLSAVMTA